MYPDGTDSIAVHFHSCRLFQAAGGTIGYRRDSSAANSTERITRSSTLVSRRNSVTAATNDVPPVPERLHALIQEAGALDRGPAVEKQAPATVIDWTLPSTRRRDYEKIDRCERGLRGLWRRLAPKRLKKSARTGFYRGGEDDIDCDAGTIRRYRLDLPDDEDVPPKYAWVSVDESNCRPASSASAFSHKQPLKRRWSCLRFRTRMS